MKKLISLFSLMLLSILSCDPYPQDEYEEEYVVEAYLVAGRQLPHVRLSTTVPADEFYSINNTHVDNAEVEIRLLQDGPFSKVDESFTFQSTETGMYETIEAHKVLPLRTYQLQISVPNAAEDIIAHTLVPDTFRIKNKTTVPEPITFFSNRQAEVTITNSSYPGRQNYYLFNVLSQTPDADSLIRFYREMYVNGGEDPDDLILLANNNSGIINEGNFEVNPDSSFTLKYPWLGFAFYGENLLVANTMDDNLYDYTRSRAVQFGANSPGEIQNVIYHVQGGVGIFGSIATDTTAIYLERSPLPGF